MKIHFIALLIISFLSIAVNAQDEKQDVIYLKNGNLYRGTIIEQVPNVSYKIRIAVGSIIAIEASDIDKVTKEDKVYLPLPPKPTHHYKDKGGFFETQLNVIYAGGSVRVIAGYKINQYAALGLGLGIGGVGFAANGGRYVDSYSDPYNGVYFPFFVYYSGDILKKNITPFYAVEAGYTMVSSPPFSGGDASYYGPVSYPRGGPMGSIGFGVHFYEGHIFRLSLSANLDIQYVRAEVYNSSGNGPYYDDHVSMTMLLPTFKIGIGLVRYHPIRATRI